MKAHLTGSRELLLTLPVIVLIVPQGTLTRTWVPELLFVGILFFIGAAVIGRAMWLSNSRIVPAGHIHPLLLIAWMYFMIFNPLWSLWNGNDPWRIAMTALPFGLLAVYYLFAMRRVEVDGAHTLLRMLAISSVLLALAVTFNFLSGELSATSARSTGIAGELTFTLPLLPMGGVLLAGWAVSSTKPRERWLCALGAMLLIAAILMTVVRGMLIAYFTGILVTLALLLLRSGKSLRTRVLRRALAAALAIPIVSAPFLAQWLLRLDPENFGDVSTILGRLDEYSAFSEAFFESPLFGMGMGHLATYPSAFDLTLSGTGISVCHSHMYFLAGTTGVVGLVLYYGLLGAGGLSLWRQARRVSGNQRQLAAITALAGAVVAGFVFTLTSTTFTTLSYNLSLGIFLYCSRLDWTKG